MWLGLRCIKMSRDLVLIEMQAFTMWFFRHRAILPYMVSSICFGNTKKIKIKTVNMSCNLSGTIGKNYIKHDIYIFDCYTDLTC